MPCPYVRTVSRMPATTDFNTIVLLGVVVSGILNLKAIIFRNFAGWNFLDVFLFDFFCIIDDSILNVVSCSVW